MHLKKATRQGFKPLIGLYSGSSCGKTFSALLLARGFVGPLGKIGMIDTESGRGSLYADVKEMGGYETLDLDQPFSPRRYIEAIAAVEQSGAAIGIIDSSSHEWEGIGGVCDMAMLAEQESRRPGLHNWRTPKMEHGQFVLRMLRSSIPWIVCVRAKQKTRQEKENGKTVIRKDDHEEPIQSEDFIFEMTAFGHLDKEHNFTPLKSMHPTLAACFPVGKPIELKHGKMLADWCAGAIVADVPKTSPETNAEDYRKRFIAKLRASFPEEKLVTYAEKNGHVIAGEVLDTWRMIGVPTTKEEFELLVKDIAQ